MKEGERVGLSSSDQSWRMSRDIYLSRGSWLDRWWEAAKGEILDTESAAEE
jgi:hypothetical protein